MNIMYELRDALATEYPRVINSGAVDSVIEYRHEISERVYIEVCHSYEELRQYESFILERQRYWTERNEAMVHNIVHWSRKFANSERFVVVCGFEHRYVLRKLLTEMYSHPKSRNSTSLWREVQSMWVLGSFSGLDNPV